MSFLSSSGRKERNIPLLYHNKQEMYETIIELARYLLYNAELYTGFINESGDLIEH